MRAKMDDMRRCQECIHFAPSREGYEWGWCWHRQDKAREWWEACREFEWQLPESEFIALSPAGIPAERKEGTGKEEER